MSHASTAHALPTATLNALTGIAEQCAKPNWDGYGAAPVVPQTIAQAKRFLEALPLNSEAPTFGAEPDGHLTLEWHRTPRQTLSISVTPECELHYAALLGSSKAYGTEPFFGEVPELLLTLIAKVTAQ